MQGRQGKKKKQRKKISDMHIGNLEKDLLSLCCDLGPVFKPWLEAYAYFTFQHHRLIIAMIQYQSKVSI
jgi:hypothetical protein